MSTIKFSTVSINAPAQEIWNILIDRIFHPQKYLPGVLEYSLQEQGQILIRKMQTTLGEVIERIIIDVKNRIITSELIEHPEFEGSTVNKILPTEEQTNFSLIAFIKNWSPKDPENNNGEFTSIKEELLVTKKIAEEKTKNNQL